MEKLLSCINNVIWGLPALLMIILVGIYIAVRIDVPQIRLFKAALRAFAGRISGDMCCDSNSSYRALCTALAATVGTGNIAGVAGAIAIGGPGSIFWMWICGLLGMGIKFAEATLAVRYRNRGLNGEFLSGPMYIIKNGLSAKWHWMATVYAFFGVIAAFGVGNATQINTVVGSINGMIGAFGGQQRPWLNLVIGIILALTLAVLLMGGAKRIGAAAEMLVPFACVCYILLALGVVVMRFDRIPQAFGMIFKGAFCPAAVTGGVVGSAFRTLRVGAARGVFTNEAGMGTAAIAHGEADVRHPVEQGLMGIIEVFLDTIVICTMTALAILCSNLQIQYGKDTGVLLAIDAFVLVYGEWISVAISAALCLFAVATVLGWGLYGIRCAQYLFGESVWKWFVLLQALTVVLGAILGTGTIWLLAEIVNGLMTLPNLMAIALLSPELLRLSNEHKNCSCPL